MRISKHFGQRPVSPRLSKASAKRIRAPRASAVSNLSPGEALHVISKAFATRLKHLSVLHPAVEHLDFPGYEIVSMPPGNIIFSLNDGESFLEEPLLMADNMTRSPKVSEVLRGLALKANFKILQGCLEDIEFQYPNLDLKQLSLNTFPLPLIQPFWNSLNHGSPLKYVHCIISGFYIALNSTKLPDANLQLAAVNEFRRKLIPRTLFHEMARAIERKVRKQFKLGKNFIAEPFDITGRKGYRIYFQLPPNHPDSQTLAPEMFQAMFGIDVKKILQKIIESTINNCVAMGLPPFLIRHYTRTCTPTRSNAFKGPGLIAGIYVGLEDRPEEFGEIVNSFKQIFGKD